MEAHFNDIGIDPQSSMIICGLEVCICVVKLEITKWPNTSDSESASACRALSLNGRLMLQPEAKSYISNQSFVVACTEET